jgi:hypothetical protein
VLPSTNLIDPSALTPLPPDPDEPPVPADGGGGGAKGLSDSTRTSSSSWMPRSGLRVLFSACSSFLRTGVARPAPAGSHMRAVSSIATSASALRAAMSASAAVLFTKASSTTSTSHGKSPKPTNSARLDANLARKLASSGTSSCSKTNVTLMEKPGGLGGGGCLGGWLGGGLGGGVGGGLGGGEGQRSTCTRLLWSPSNSLCWPGTVQTPSKCLRNAIGIGIAWSHGTNQAEKGETRDTYGCMSEAERVIEIIQRSRRWGQRTALTHHWLSCSYPALRCQTCL